MIKISSKIHREGHDLCGKSIYSNRYEDYTYNTDKVYSNGFTRYYFDNVLLKTKSDKVVVLIFKDLYWKSFHATYDCLCGSETVKVCHEDIKEILNEKNC